MRLMTLLTLAAAVVAIGCDADSGGTQSTREAGAGTQSSSGSARGGMLMVGEDSWTFVPATQCSIYPGNVVSIAGHAAEDPSVEIVLDYGGPTGVRIGTYSREPWWQAVRDTIEVEIEGRRRISGTATFEVFRNGAKETAEGSFDISCY